MGAASGNYLLGFLLLGNPFAQNNRTVALCLARLRTPPSERRVRDGWQWCGDPGSRGSPEAREGPARVAKHSLSVYSRRRMSVDEAEEKVRASLKLGASRLRPHTHAR